MLWIIFKNSHKKTTSCNCTKKGSVSGVFLWIYQGDYPAELEWLLLCNIWTQKQPSRGVLRKRRSENMQQADRRTPIPKCDLNGCSPVNLLHIFCCKLKSYHGLKIHIQLTFTWSQDTYVCVSGGKECSFFGKFGMLCFLETPVLRFALLPYYRRIGW